MSNKSWGRLSLKERIRMRLLAKDSSLGGVVIREIKDNGDIIHVRSNSLGTMAWICGMPYNERLPDTANGDSSYAVYGDKRPGFVSPSIFGNILSRDFKEINDAFEFASSGDIAVVHEMPKQNSYGYSPILGAGVCLGVNDQYINVFGQNDFSPHNFGTFKWDYDWMWDSGLECRFYRRIE